MSVAALEEEEGEEEEEEEEERGDLQERGWVQDKGRGGEWRGMRWVEWYTVGFERGIEVFVSGTVYIHVNSKLGGYVYMYK